MTDPKKPNFRIEAFKHINVFDPKDAEKTWRIIDHAIHEFYNHNASDISFEQLYRSAYIMVFHNFGEKLYSGLVSTMNALLREVSNFIDAQEGLFLEEMNRKWNDHTKVLRMIQDALMYMDRTYVPSARKTHIHELGLNLWRDNVIYSDKIRTRLRTTLLELILRERNDEVINRGLMRNILKMLTDLGRFVYQEDFEKPFLEVSSEFYRGESQRFIECCDCRDYLKKAERRLNEEVERVSQYLDAKSEAKITSVVEKEMIANHMLRLVHMENSGLVKMILDDKYDDLRRMYILFGRVFNGLTTMCDVMTSHLKEAGKELVTDRKKLKNPVEFVQQLVDMKDKYENIINSPFTNDRMFLKALDSSFKYFINLNQRLPEFISLFVDDKLRIGLKGVSEEDPELILDKVIMLFSYLQEKDVFETYYKKHLAKRLLSGKSVSVDVERSFLQKLKAESGCIFVWKLEVMLKDMKTSEDTMQGFYASHPELGARPTLTVQVLTTGSWPTQPSVPCNLPAEMSALCDKFRPYYLGIHTGRKLSWQTSMGTADIKASFGKGQKHELNVSTYQMCVLMLFNSAEQLSYREIEQATEIPAADLKMCLQSLACVKGTNVLRKEPVSREITEDDMLSVNEEFVSKLYKVTIETVAAKESELEKKKTWHYVENDRRHQIEAALVRIMKAHKALDHNNLIAEVTRQLQPHFLADPKEIKKRIEFLIEGEYIERDATDPGIFRYLA